MDQSVAGQAAIIITREESGFAIRAAAGLPPSAKIVKRSKSRPNLVNVRIGNHSEFLKWFDRSRPRNWDLMLSFYNIPSDPIPLETDSIIVGGRSKFSSVKDSFDEDPTIYTEYDQILFLDDDIIMNFEDVDRLFALTAEYRLDLAQASLSDHSTTNWGFLRHRKGTIIRYTNFVEVMMPVFSRKGFLACVESFSQSISAWGLDFMWPHLLEYPERGIGVVDPVVAQHTRAADVDNGPFYKYLRSINVDPLDELARITPGYGLPHDHYRVIGSVPQTVELGHEAWMADHAGESYLDFLDRLHKVLNPKTYLEIGTRKGDSLALASCRSIAIDPAFNLTSDFQGEKPICCLFQMGSDEFFAAHDPAAILGQRIDLAFLDGMHLSEFLLRDFMNIEKFIRPNSVIAIHDCLPLNAAMANRSEAYANAHGSPDYAGWWTGDVWKTIMALKTFRPELKILAVDAAPTGLILITGLNPSSTILSDRYFDIVQAMHDESRDDRDKYQDYLSSLTMTSSYSLNSLEDFSKHFWL